MMLGQARLELFQQILGKRRVGSKLLEPFDDPDLPQDMLLALRNMAADHLDLLSAAHTHPIDLHGRARTARFVENPTVRAGLPHPSGLAGPGLGLRRRSGRSAPRCRGTASPFPAR